MKDDDVFDQINQKINNDEDEIVKMNRFNEAQNRLTEFHSTAYTDPVWGNMMLNVVLEMHKKDYFEGKHERWSDK